MNFAGLGEHVIPRVWCVMEESEDGRGEGRGCVLGSLEGGLGGLGDFLGGREVWGEVGWERERRRRVKGI